jgi:hypothetical protein
MGKRKTILERISAVLMIAIISLLLVTPVLADTSQPVVISTMDTNDTDGITSPAQKNTFYASGRQWEFYINGDDDFVYTSFEQGVNTLSTSSILDSSNLYGPEISVWYDSNTHKVSYARHDLIGKNTVYRQGTPASTGVIAWDADEQIVHATTSNLVTFRVAICTDEDGYPYVAWIDDGPTDNTTGVLYIRSSSTKNGVWTEDIARDQDYAGTQHIWFVQLTPIDSLPYPRVEAEYTMEDISGGGDDGEFSLMAANDLDNFVTQYTISASGTISTGSFGSLFSFNTCGTSAMRGVWTSVGNDVLYGVRSASENWSVRATPDVEILSSTASGDWAPTLSTFDYFTGTETICIANNDRTLKYTLLPGPMTMWEDPFTGTWVTIWDITDTVNDKISRHSASYLADTDAGVPLGFTWQVRYDFGTPIESNVVYNWWFDEGQLGYYEGVTSSNNVSGIAEILSIVVVCLYILWALSFLSRDLTVKNIIIVVVGAVIIIAFSGIIASMIASW